MLDVHPPHEPVHSWRDFLLHLITIAIGLLIALSLEGLVEWRPHRHLVAEARENIRTEILANQKLLETDIKSIQSNETQMQRNMDALRALRTDPDAHGSVTLAWSWSAMNGSAWQTARDTGALAYMPYDQVQGYADVYLQQDIVDRAAGAIINSEVLAGVPLLIEKAPSPHTPAQIDEALHHCAETYLQLKTLEDLIVGLKRNYIEALNIR